MKIIHFHRTYPITVLSTKTLVSFIDSPSNDAGVQKSLNFSLTATRSSRSNLGLSKMGFKLGSTLLSKMVFREAKMPAWTFSDSDG